MNALVQVRNNQAGQLSPTREQRKAAMEEITSSLRAKLEAQEKSAAGQTTAKATDDTLPQKELGKDAFLQLLVMQMQYQDPMSPVENTDMIAQLAQFSSLEQMNNLNESFTNLSEEVEFLSGNMDQLNFISAQGLLGKYVTGVDSEGKDISGNVEAVQLRGSIVVLTVDGQQLPMTGVVSVGTEPADDAAEETTDEAGKSLRKLPGAS